MKHSINITFNGKIVSVLTTKEEFTSYIQDHITDKFKEFTNHTWNIIQSIQESTISQTDFIKYIKKYIFGGKTSQGSLLFWTLKGYTEGEAKQQIIREQRRRSRFCVEYWINHGRTEEEARFEISKIQSGNNKKLQHKYNTGEKNPREYSPRCIEYWMKMGYNKEEAEKAVYNTHTLGSNREYMEEKHGRGIIEEINKKKACCGEKNGMYGKSSPNGSGSGYSGFYKSYYFRSLLEYAYMKQLEKEDISFICNDVNIKYLPNKVRIQLDDNHTYTPDFIVGRNIIEIKSEYNRNSETTLIKEKHAIDYVNNSERFDKYMILTENNIKLDEYELLADVNSGLLKIDNGKAIRFNKLYNKIVRRLNSET